MLAEFYESSSSNYRVLDYSSSALTTISQGFSDGTMPQLVSVPREKSTPESAVPEIVATTGDRLDRKAFYQGSKIELDKIEKFM